MPPELPGRHFRQAHGCDVGLRDRHVEVNTAPGPIGMVAAGISAVSYAAAGEWGNAGIMAAGIALAAVEAGAVVVAVKVARIVREARAVEVAVRDGMKAKTGIEVASRVARGGRIHNIAKGFTRPLERLRARVDPAIPRTGGKLRPDWRFGRHVVEMKRGSAAGIAAGTAKLHRYRQALGRRGTNWLLTYPERPGHGWHPRKWRLHRIR